MFYSCRNFCPIRHLHSRGSDHIDLTAEHFTGHNLSSTATETRGSSSSMSGTGPPCWSGGCGHHTHTPNRRASGHRAQGSWRGSAAGELLSWVRAQSALHPNLSLGTQGSSHCSGRQHRPPFLPRLDWGGGSHREEGVGLCGAGGHFGLHLCTGNSISLKSTCTQNSNVTVFRTRVFADVRSSSHESFPDLGQVRRCLLRRENVDT